MQGEALAFVMKVFQNAIMIPVCILHNYRLHIDSRT